MFNRLCQLLSAQPDRRGEAHIPCPWCGKEPARGQVHFSVSERGGHCFCCGNGGSVYQVAARLGLEGKTPRPVVVPRPPAHRPRPKPTADFGQLARVYETYPGRVELWRAYKPLWPETIEAYRLGYGSFPQYTSRCQHPRLMVPLIAEGKVVGFRGRRVEGCTCEGKVKWLSPVGTVPVLYNGERLGAQGPLLGMAAGDRLATGRTLFIVENPLDALLLEQLGQNVTAVATLSVSQWNEGWTDLIRLARPRSVIVAYDNDRPGNGGGVIGRERWLRAHPRDIEPGGVRLVNQLLAAGVPARLFPWPKNAPEHADIGDLLAQKEAV